MRRNKRSQSRSKRKSQLLSKAKIKTKAQTSGLLSIIDHLELFAITHRSKFISPVITSLYPLEIIPNKTTQVCSNDFQPLKVIGRGGFSKVFLVRKKDSGLLFAMKVMQKSFVMTDGKFKQVMCERSIMETLDHPFIVKLHWAFQAVSV